MHSAPPRSHAAQATFQAFERELASLVERFDRNESHQLLASYNEATRTIERSEDA